MAAPQGFEPRYAAPEAAVLPLNEGAARAGLRIHRCKTRKMIVLVAAWERQQNELLTSTAQMTVKRFAHDHVRTISSALE
jgi:hypothetical protein